jgi:hypothetical protein
MARTIDNLGIDSSTRYAEDRAYYDDSFVKEARIPLQAQIDVTLPSYASEFDLLFETDKRYSRYATIPAPRGFYEQKRLIFSNLIIPHLGTLDKRETLLQKLSQMGMGGNANQPYNLEQEKTSFEREALISLLKKLQSLDQTLIDINSKRTQYQKG